MFQLSLLHVENVLAERGIEVSFQTAPEWASKFGSDFARSFLRRSRGNFSEKERLDEMVVTIKGEKFWLWRVVDAEGYGLEALGISYRNKEAAPNLMRKLLRRKASRRVMATDKLILRCSRA